VKALASESRSRASGVLELPLSDFEQLFNAPSVNPLSRAVPEILGVSGAEYVLHQLETRRNSIEILQLILPAPARSDTDSSDQIQQALQRYAEYRIQEQQALARETRRRGWRVTAAALVLLAACLAISQIFTSEITEGMRPLLRTTMEYGFEIVGWVMLWHPIEILVFEPLTIKHRINALRRLMSLQVMLKTGDSDRP
jgi:hypothetical protein